jgi:hypothetical protein
MGVMGVMGVIRSRFLGMHAAGDRSPGPAAAAGDSLSRKQFRAFKE